MDSQSANGQSVIHLGNKAAQIDDWSFIISLQIETNLVTIITRIIIAVNRDNSISIKIARTLVIERNIRAVKFAYPRDTMNEKFSRVVDPHGDILRTPPLIAPPPHDTTL